MTGISFTTLYNAYQHVTINIYVVQNEHLFQLVVVDSILLVHHKEYYAEFGYASLSLELNSVELQWHNWASQKVATYIGS